MIDNYWSNLRSADVAAVIATLGAKHKFIKPHCPWRNGKVERFNRTLQAEWANRYGFTSNAERAAALAPAPISPPTWATPTTVQLTGRCASPLISRSGRCRTAVAP